MCMQDWSLLRHKGLQGKNIVSQDVRRQQPKLDIVTLLPLTVILPAIFIGVLLIIPTVLSLCLESTIDHGLMSL
jgi:hypothetical protein